MANLNDLDLKICATEGDIPSEAPEKDQLILVRGEGGGAEIIGGTLTLATGDWSGTTATKTITGLTDNDIVKVAPVSKTDATNWATANIWVTQSGTTLTFTADTAPTVSIAVIYEITKEVLA